MSQLRQSLTAAGFADVTTYIQSGNVLLRSPYSATRTATVIETLLTKQFTLDSAVVKTLVLTQAQLQSIVDARPPGFGDQPAVYHSDVIFLIGIDVKQALAAFDPRDSVDTIWPGNGVIYSRRLSAQRTKSRLSKIVGTALYHSMTIRNWNTTIKLLELLKNLD